MIWMHGTNAAWWWFPVGMLWMVVFWGGLIWVVAWAIRWATRREKSEGSPSPLDIAKARYARGEISKEQFEQLKRDIA